MAQPTISYFDFHGGRGEPARRARAIGGIPFEDDRVPPAEWQSRKAHTPFGALPVLERWRFHRRLSARHPLAGRALDGFGHCSGSPERDEVATLKTAMRAAPRDWRFRCPAPAPGPMRRSPRSTSQARLPGC